MTYLSIVAASRNDDHGGNPLLRTQIFINNLARQCEKYKIEAELIIVDWNPVSERPNLSCMLSIPKTSYLTGRVIVVPTELHNGLKYSDKLSFFQMIAKNVGIRRARGEFVLATNIDIIFSEELMCYISKKILSHKHVYRVDRFDIKCGLTLDNNSEEIYNFAWQNIIRKNIRFEPTSIIQKIYDKNFNKTNIESLKNLSDSVNVFYEHNVFCLSPKRASDMRYIHTNGCGDFTLMSKKSWEYIRGYPEFESFSFNIDSLGLLAAHYAGFTEITLLPPCVCFHIEHSAGSGWTPEHSDKLFNRLEKEKIPVPEWNILTPLVDDMQKLQDAIIFNSIQWGLNTFKLPEETFGAVRSIKYNFQDEAKNQKISSLFCQYDLNFLRNFSHAKYRNNTRVKFCFSNAIGQFLRENVIEDAPLNSLFEAEFQLSNLKESSIMKLVPGHDKCKLLIHSICAINEKNQKKLWEIPKITPSAPKLSTQIKSLLKKIISNFPVFRVIKIKIINVFPFLRIFKNNLQKSNIKGNRLLYFDNKDPYVVLPSSKNISVKLKVKMMIVSG